MQELLMYRCIPKIILFILAFSMADDGLALSSDADQPIELEADFAEFDDRTRVTTYTGNVIADQGSLHMTGDVLTVDYSDDRQIEKVTVTGKPARFRQRLEGDEADTEGEALTIEYYALKELLVLTVNAKLIQGTKRLSAHQIDYDKVNKMLKAHKTSEASEKGEERVKVIILPEGDSVGSSESVEKEDQ